MVLALFGNLIPSAEERVPEHSYGASPRHAPMSWNEPEGDRVRTHPQRKRHNVRRHEGRPHAIDALGDAPAFHKRLRHEKSRDARRRQHALVAN